MFHTAKQLLGHSLSRAGIDRKVDAARAAEEFITLVVERFGPMVRNRLGRAALKHGDLSVEVSSAGLASEIALASRELADAINKKIGRAVVRSIVVRQG